MGNSESGLEKISDALETAITGIPAPLRKSFFKAFGQLCTAAVDVPVSWLEGKADERRAITEARIKIIKKEGEKFYENTDVPKEYFAKASAKYASKIIKEQLVWDEITLTAAQELAGKTVKDNENDPEEISDDWLNEFENEARLKTSEEMKLIFSKILSGEITNPGAFSIRTIKLIAQLDNQAARLFRLLCSLSISINLGDVFFDARVVSLSGNAGANSLGEYGLAFDHLNILQEYGLIISDYNSYMNYSPCIAHDGINVAASFRFDDKNYALIPIDNESYDKILNLHGVTFTKAGKELLS